MKRWWQSKTIWLNAAPILTLVTSPTFTTDPPVLKWGAVALGVVNLVLRCLTNTGIGSAQR